MLDIHWYNQSLADAQKMLSQLSGSSRIAASVEREFICVIAMQEFEWQGMDDVDTSGLDDADMCKETSTLFQIHFGLKKKSRK